MHKEGVEGKTILGGVRDRDRERERERRPGGQHRNNTGHRNPKWPQLLIPVSTGNSTGPLSVLSE